MKSASQGICKYVDHELKAAKSLEHENPVQAFRHLERAHILGQHSTIQHVRAHWYMFRWGLRQSDFRECVGQLFRIVGAATKTAIGWVPRGNTGGANVSPFKSMEVPADLAAVMSRASELK